MRLAYSCGPRTGRVVCGQYPAMSGMAIAGTLASTRALFGFIQVFPQLLASLGYDTTRFCSKSWNEFAKPGAPALDFVFTVCDNAAGETCPVWPGQPMTAHWGIPDPAEAKGGSAAEIGLAFRDAYRMLSQRIGVFAALPIRSLDQLSLQRRLDEIGRMEGAKVAESS
jgi:arsenate reductase (thioredoxin)